MKINRKKLRFYSGSMILLLGVILSIIGIYLYVNENDIIEAIAQILMCLSFFIMGFTISSYVDYYE